MEKIDNKIDILLRQKLLMNYNPSMNLTENINTYSNKNSVIESKTTVVKKIKDAAWNTLKSFGGKSAKVGKSIGKGLVNISGAIFNRYTLGRIWKISPTSIVAASIYFFYRLVRRSNTELYKDDIVGIFAQCKKVLDTPTDAHIKQAEQLNYALNEGFKIGRLGVDVKEVTRIFESIDTIGELCLVNNAFYTKYASTGQRDVLVKQLLSYDNFDATVRTKALANVLNNIKSGIDTVQVNCVGHLLTREGLEFKDDKPYVQIKETLNPDLQKHGGIIIYKGNTWKTTDRKIKGEYTCDTEKPKEIQFRSGSCVYYITDSEKAKEGCIGKKDVAATAAAGSSGAVGSTVTKLCPNSYSPPIDGVYKQCTIGEPVKVVQRCLGSLVDDGKFGIKTLNQLRTLKGIEQFTEADVSKICAVQANTTAPTQSDTPPVAATVKPKYQPLDVVPIGSSSDNLYAERF